MVTRVFAICASALVLLAFTTKVQAASMAYDDASNPVYDSGWSTGQNGGTGFGPWTVTNGTEETFIGSSADNGVTPSGHIDTLGESWGLYSPGGVTEAVRFFTPGGNTGTSALGVGEQFVFKLDNGFLNTGGPSIGLGLRSGSTSRFSIVFTGGEGNYELMPTGPNYQVPHAFTDDGFTVIFTLLPANKFALDIIWGDGAPPTAMTGDLINSGGIDNFRVFNNNAGVDFSNDLYINSVQVIPEPTSVVLLALGVVALSTRRGRRERGA